MLCSLTQPGKNYTVAADAPSKEVCMSVVIGYWTLIGAVVGMALPGITYVLLLARVRNTLANSAEKATREEVEDIFALQGINDLYADGDHVDANGKRRTNWLHRAFVLWRTVRYPALIGAIAGFVLENLLNLIF